MIDAAERKAKKKAADAAYYAAHHAEVKARQAAWRVAHREERKAANAAYRAVHREETRARAATYRAAAAKARRRARKLNAGGNHTPAEREAIFTAHQSLCAWCRGLGYLTIAGHLDHVIPLARGGSNAIENCAPACERCNVSKGARDPDAFYLAVAVDEYLRRHSSIYRPSRELLS